jgi:uncharacterized phage protein (TIGR01671 family)
MRQVKFRAWDKHENKMITKFMIGSSTDPESKEWTCPIVWIGNEWLNHEGLILMQFTGLQDKNGVDIYEGDIIRFLDCVDCSTESGNDFNEIVNVGVIYFCDQDNGWDITKREQDKEDVFVSDNMEVIGNIHENPELLESVK